MERTLNDLNVKIYADGADRAGMQALYRRPMIKGFTTNPTLLRKAGVRDYEAFAKQLLADIPDRPISFEVIADDFDEMERQARRIGAWGDNVYVKVPVSNTRGESSVPLLRNLAFEGIKLNVTAVFTLEQVAEVGEAIGGMTPAVVSVFAGRIADTGRDPMPIMQAARALLDRQRDIELLWASPRELLNIFQADACGCQIITVAHDLLAKLELVGKDLDQFSIETVRMFHDDACAAGFALSQAQPARHASVASI